jgi:hypothetical protein
LMRSAMSIGETDLKFYEDEYNALMIDICLN